jgi:hypothetical protein
MNKVKILTGVLNFGSLMILMTAIGETVRRILNWIKSYGKKVPA